MYLMIAVYSENVILLLLVCAEVCDTEGDIRLVNGSNKFEGRVEYCNDSEWKSVCNNGFFNEEIIVACRQIGFSGEFNRKFNNSNQCFLDINV